MTLQELDGASTEEATNALAQCCGSETWVNGMLVLRPFGDLQALHAAADQVWWSLTEQDWLDAFAKHPRIGDKAADAKWASDEQSGMDTAGRAIAEEMRHMNGEYEARFGYTYIICATGKSAVEMHSNLRERLGNDRADEIRIAAAQQAEITQLRLEKLLAER